MFFRVEFSLTRRQVLLYNIQIDLEFLFSSSDFMKMLR